MSDVGKIRLPPLLLFIEKHAAALLREARIPLIRARLSDAIDGAGERRPPAELFQKLTNEFEADDWSRIVLLADCLFSISDEFCLYSPDEDEEEDSIFRELTSLARSFLHLTPDVILESKIRQEEFARALLFHLRAPIFGESPEESLARLDRLDFAKALSLVEEAEKNAQDRLKILKDLQTHADELLQPRGKW